MEDSRRLRILVVEDDPLVRMAVTEQLTSQGHTVQSAVNGLEGLDTFMSGRFDLVLTDRAMPEMGGDQLATTIKQVAANKPIIMLTGFGDLMDAKGEQPAGGVERRAAPGGRALAPGVGALARPVPAVRAGRRPARPVGGQAGPGAGVPRRGETAK